LFVIETDGRFYGLPVSFKTNFAHHTIQTIYKTGTGEKALKIETNLSPLLVKAKNVLL
jgi:hypothetical protein